MTTIAPLYVIDCNTGEGCPCAPARKDLVEWLAEHGVEGKLTHRLEFYLIDIPFVRVFQYEPDLEPNRKIFIRCDPKTGEPVQRRPFDVITRSDLPPCPHERP